MLVLENVDLAADSDAAWYCKDEIVEVRFATAAGQLASREGANHFRPFDALVKGSTGDEWSVSRDRFDDRYRPVAPTVAGEDGAYRAQPRPVLARQIRQAFRVARSAGGDLLTGVADDWLLQYAPGDFGLVENARFQRVYRSCAPPALSPPTTN
jgi:hypothetical protein